MMWLISKNIKYLQKIEAQGGNKVVKEMQKQIDEWKAANGK